MIHINNFVHSITPEVLGCPLQTVEAVVRDSIIQFCQDTWVLQKALTVVTQAYKENLSDFGAGDLTNTPLVQVKFGRVEAQGIRPIGIVRMLADGTEYKLRYLQLMTECEDLTDQTDTKYYYFQDDNSALIVYPMGAAVRLYLELAVTPTYDATHVDSVLYNEWKNPIERLARSRLFKMPARAWTDIRLGLIEEREYRRGVNQAKARMRKNKSAQALSFQDTNTYMSTLWL